MFRVYFKTKYLNRDKFCGEFNTLELAMEQIDYLTEHLKDGSKLKFEIRTYLKNYETIIPSIKH